MPAKSPRLTHSPPLFRESRSGPATVSVTFSPLERQLAAEVRDLLLRYDAPARGDLVPRSLTGRLHARSLVAAETRDDDLRAFARRETSSPSRPRLLSVLLCALASVRLTEIQRQEDPGGGGERP